MAGRYVRICEYLHWIARYRPGNDKVQDYDGEQGNQGIKNSPGNVCPAKPHAATSCVV